MVASCAAAGIPCPWGSATCICSPCKAVPSQAVAIYVTKGASVAAAGSSSYKNNSAPAGSILCSKLSVCATVKQVRGRTQSALMTSI